MFVVSSFAFLGFACVVADLTDKAFAALLHSLVATRCKGSERRLWTATSRAFPRRMRPRRVAVWLTSSVGSVALAAHAHPGWQDFRQSVQGLFCGVHVDELRVGFPALSRRIGEAPAVLHRWSHLVVQARFRTRGFVVCVVRARAAPGLSFETRLVRTMLCQLVGACRCVCTCASFPSSRTWCSYGCAPCITVRRSPHRCPGFWVDDIAG